MQACQLFFNFPFIHSLTGVPLAKYFEHAEIMMQSQIQAFEMLGLDPIISPDFGTVIESSALGGIVKFDRMGFPSVHPSGIKSFEDVKHLKIINPYDGGYVTKALETLAYMKAHASRNVKVSSVLMIGPFTVAAQVRGISDFCMDLFDEPEMTAQLLDVVVESEIVYLKEQEKILGPLESILIGDDIAGFVSEAQFREWVMPTYKKIYAKFPKAKKWLHNDANAAHLAGAFADCGFELWHLGDCVDMVKACTDARNEVTVVGNLSPVECLKNGTEKSVREAANALIERFTGNRKFVLSAGGYISYGTPLENVRAMLHSAQAH